MHGSEWFGHTEDEPNRQEGGADAGVPTATHGRNVTPRPIARQAVLGTYGVGTGVLVVVVTMVESSSAVMWPSAATLKRVLWPPVISTR